MDCRQFRENHCAFIDDTMPGIELVGMQVHLTECRQCAEHDARVRRSLMLFRSLPRIEPSESFGRRLEARLKEVRQADSAPHAGRARRFTATVALSSAAMLGYIGFSLRHVDTPRSIAFPPVVAMAPGMPEAVASPAPEMVAAISAGVPIWTAALLAEQTPVHFASLEMMDAAR
jgi:hypothetical protein